MSLFVASTHLILIRMSENGSWECPSSIHQRKEGKTERLHLANSLAFYQLYDPVLRKLL